MRVAYRVTTGTGDKEAIQVVVARDLVEAVTFVHGQLTLGGEVQTIELLGSAVIAGEVGTSVAPTPRTSRPKPPRSAPPKPASGATAPPPRRLQLVALLEQRGGPIHIAEVATGLGVTPGNAGNVVADAVRHGLVRRVGSRTGRVELVGGDAVVKPEVPATPKVGASAAAPPEAKKKRGGPSHADRLVELLRQRAEPVHLDELVTHLDTTRGTVQEVIRAAAKAGRVRRVGSKTGMVVLAEVGKPEASEGDATTPAKRRDPTRARQVLQVLRRRGGSATVSAIATSLGTDDKKAKAAIDQAVLRRWVRHLDDGRIGLMPAMMAGLEKPPADPAKLTGVQKRVFDVLENLKAPATAKEIAERLGVRPREAGNAAAVLVESALAERVEGGDKPKYRPVR